MPMQGMPFPGMQMQGVPYGMPPQYMMQSMGMHPHAFPPFATVGSRSPLAIIKYELCPQIPCSLSVPSLTLAPAQGVMGMTEPAQPTAGGKLRRKRRKQEKVFPPLPTIFRAGPHRVRHINRSHSSQTGPAKAALMCGLRDSRSQAGRVLQKTPHG